MIPRLASGFMLALLLAACSSNKDKEEDSKVAKLVDYDKRVSMQRLWSSDAGAEGKRRQYKKLVPAIAGDRIFVADPKGSVFAFELENGKRLWRTKTDYAISGGVGASPTLVVFGTLDGQVVALDAATGDVKWEAAVSSEVLAAPMTDGAVVVAQTIDARVFAFDAQSGQMRWSYDHLAPVLSLRGTSGPVLTQTQAICAFDNGQIVSFSLIEGARGWEERISQPKGKTDLERIVDVDGTPLVESGIVYAAGYQGNIVALSRSQGNVIWRRDVSTYQPLAAGSGRIFASTEKSRIVAFNAGNGDVLWENEALLNRETSAPAVIGEYVAVIDKEDYLHLMLQSDGSFAYRFKPAGDGFHAPMLSHRNRLYILSDDSRLSAYELEPL